MGIYIIVGIIYRYWSGFSDLYGCSSCNSSSNAKNQLRLCGCAAQVRLHHRAVKRQDTTHGHIMSHRLLSDELRTRELTLGWRQSHC